jgi:hypothetical protein
MTEPRHATKFQEILSHRQPVKLGLLRPRDVLALRTELSKHPAAAASWRRAIALSINQRRRPKPCSARRMPPEPPAIGSTSCAICDCDGGAIDAPVPPTE